MLTPGAHYRSSGIRTLQSYSEHSSGAQWRFSATAHAICTVQFLDTKLGLAIWRRPSSIYEEWCCTPVPDSLHGSSLLHNRFANQLSKHPMRGHATYVGDCQTSCPAEFGSQGLWLVQLRLLWDVNKILQPPNEMKRIFHVNIVQMHCTDKHYPESRVIITYPGRRPFFFETHTLS
jgi:hypothetical protein